MRSNRDVVAEIQRLELRNAEINEITKDVEVLWAWKVGNPLFRERERNLFKILALEWVLRGDND